MEVQSLSVCVPAGCPNRCKFCVSRMHEERYPNRLEKNADPDGPYELDFNRRLQFARDNGCNTLLLTGTGEALGNRAFLERFAEWNRQIEHPFRWIELQTSGVFLGHESLDFLRRIVGVCTLSLSLSDMFDSDNNAEINGTPDRLRVDVEATCAAIRAQDFNLRLSLNMSDVYDPRPVHSLFERAGALGAHQITFRRLYASGDPALPENQWVAAHRYARFNPLQDYIVENGRMLEILPFGAARYSIHGLSAVVDADCMSREAKNVIKYLILRPDCRLYTKWDDPGSLLF